MMTDIKRKVLSAPSAFAAMGGFFRLISESDDPYRLIYYTKQGDLDRAFDTFDASDEEIHERIDRIREDARNIGVEAPEIREADEEEIIEESRREARDTAIGLSVTRGVAEGEIEEADEEDEGEIEEADEEGSASW